jgi:hypothetical protein
MHGMTLGIESPKGTMRTGRGWQVRMPADYGFIVGVKGADGDSLDCYVADNAEAQRVFVVDQNTFDGKTFDEHKVVLGCDNIDEAERIYRAGHHASSKVLRGITQMSVHRFKRWIKHAAVDGPLVTVDAVARPAVRASDLKPGDVIKLSGRKLVRVRSVNPAVNLFQEPEVHVNTTTGESVPFKPDFKVIVYARGTDAR